MSAGAPLKIGITCYPSVGGSGILASALGEELARRGHEIHFISYEKPFRMPADDPRIRFHPVEVNAYGLFRYPDYTLPLSVKMAEVSQQFGLDILHVHYAVPHATAALLARGMLPADRRPAIVTTLHGTDTTLLGSDPGYGPAIRHALEQADAVTAVSHFLKRETQRLLAVQRPIDVVHNFFEPKPLTRERAEVRAELGVRDGETLLLHLSNLRPLKRVDLLLESFARMKRVGTAKLVVLAGGDFEPFLPLVRKLGLEDRLVVKYNVLEVDNYLNAADLGVFTSETESFCLSILELMAFGVPSVSTRVGGIPEVVQTGGEGVLVDTAQPADIAAQIDAVVGDPAQRQALGAAGARKARAQFSAAAIVPQYLDVYRRVLAPRG